MKLERRAFELTDLEVRADENEPKKIRGYAAIFEKLSVPLWGFREKISKGAFAESIKKDDIRALWNHDPNYVLGRNKSGTLALEEDDKGLKIEVTPPDTQWARDLLVSIERKDVTQMSFGFEVEKDEWDRSDEKNVIRTLLKTRLFDVSPVTFPAYPQTSVGVRSAEEVYNEFLASELQGDKDAEEKRNQELAKRKKTEIETI